MGVASAVALRLMVYCKSKNAKKYRRGVEYGSARWGGPKDIAPYIDPVFDNNILLTQTERLTMNNRPKDPKTARNKTCWSSAVPAAARRDFCEAEPDAVRVQGLSGLFHYHRSQRGLIGEVGQLLVRSGYRVKVLNTINFSKSMRYNPFRYIHSEKEHLKAGQHPDLQHQGRGEKALRIFGSSRNVCCIRLSLATSGTKRRTMK